MSTAGRPVVACLKEQAIGCLAGGVTRGLARGKEAGTAKDTSKHEQPPSLAAGVPALRTYVGGMAAQTGEPLHCRRQFSGIR